MKNSIYLLVILLFPTLISAQTHLTIDSVVNNIRKQSILFPQEKIYVQNDKSSYIAGEDIWFRIHLADAASHIPDTTSHYVYAELINPEDSLVKRIKVRSTDGAYHGHITLEEDIPAGNYQLRFYTRFMENIGEDYFFRKSISIGDPLSALYNTIISSEPEESGTRLSLMFRDITSNEYINPQKIHYKDHNGNLKETKIEDNNAAYITIKNKNKKSDILYIEYDYDGKFHKQYIPIPSDPTDYDISFFPEGGNFPAGKYTRIAFKSINTHGLGEEITGFIVNEKGDTINTIQSRHLGMGFFVLNSEPDTKYYAVCKNEKGVEKRFQIPEAKANTVSLQTNMTQTRINITPITNTDIDSLYIFILCRGNLLHTQEWNQSKEYMSIQKDKLPSGIIQILLTDSQYTPLSERLMFNNNEDDISKVLLNTEKENYDKRQLVKSKIHLEDSEGISLDGDFSISVIDNNDMHPDSTINILTSMLLTSDIKGYVESPSYYFDKHNTQAAHYLDILMMTQGWRRYNMTNVIKGKFDIPSIPIEQSYTVSGSVKGGIFVNKAANNYPVTLISTNRPIYASVNTNQKGNFRFEIENLPDSTNLIIQATTPKNGKHAELTLKPTLYPDITQNIPWSYTSNKEESYNYFKKADQKFTIENGMRMIYLKDVLVTAKRTETRLTSRYSSVANNFISNEDIKRRHPNNMMSLIAGLPGISIRNNTIIKRLEPMRLILDDLVVSYDDLMQVDINSIDFVEVGTMNNVLIFSSIEGVRKYKESDPINIKTLNPLGYQITKEFYSPKYETKEQVEDQNPDLRTTIYWNPSVKTKEGKANISFYTADASTTYSVIIEGITNDGRLIHSIKEISRQDR